MPAAAAETAGRGPPLPLASGARIAVIGAGAAGLVATRVLRDDGFDVTCFEVGTHVGGTWIYSEADVHDAGDDANGERLVHSSMYASLRTNLPKEIMAFPGFPFPARLRSFPGHADVAAYLQQYAERYELHSSIRFGVRVAHVRPLDCGDSRANYELVTHAGARERFAAVVVCNGHYTAPLAPSDEQIPNLNYYEHGRGRTFAGVIMHSHFYRRPDAFRGKRVLCLGAGPSGVDISLDVAAVAASHQPVYLSQCGVKSMAEAPPPRGGVQPCPALARVTGADTVRLADGTTLQLDAIVLCTGYRFSFPFMSLAEMGIAVTHGGRVVEPLYRHMVPVHRPTLPLIGTPFSVLPFPLFEYQVRYMSAVFRGSVALPSETEMRRAVEEEAERRRAFGVAAHHLHKLGDEQWEYDRRLADAGGAVPGPTLAVQAVYNDASVHRKRDALTYREREYIMSGDGPEDWAVREHPRKAAAEDDEEAEAMKATREKDART